MKHHIRTVARGAALLAAVAMVACGGKQTMASKSAAAYDEAKKKGIPIASGEHGGHSAEAGAATTATAPAAMPGMDQGAMPGMQPSTSGSGARDMAGMDHSKMSGMQHGSAAAGAHDMAEMEHSAMPGMAHGSMPGIQHRSRTAAPLVIAPPTSNAAIAQTQPAATLRADEFDAPAPAAIEEAAKGASGMSHSMEKMTPNPPAPAQDDHKPPPSEHRQHSGGEAS